jgi:hypothetical protein
MFPFAGSGISRQQYSLSEPTGSGNEDNLASDESMDWSDNLPGVNKLFGNKTASPDKDTMAAHAATLDGSGGSPTVDALQPPPPPPPPPPPSTTEKPAVVPPVGLPTKGSAGEPAAVVQHPPEGLVAEGGGRTAMMRARVYLAKVREEEVARLKAGLGNKLLDYEAILAARLRDLATPHLLDSPAAAAPDVGNMLSTGDGRLLNVWLDINMAQKLVTTASFNPDTMRCYCSGPHSRFRIASTGGGQRPGKEAFLLTDQ